MATSVGKFDASEGTREELTKAVKTICHRATESRVKIGFRVGAVARIARF
ncbi:MAG TPA: hypothetical protein VG146_03140 [Verrucomicrobiae bacterium]|nr:hypothetical protein [Verrucomicrobiae bacterium]